MNRNLYPWLIFFQALVGLATLLQSLFHLYIGPQLYTLDSFIGWLLITNFAACIASLLLLYYFYSEKYWFVVIAGAFSTLCNLCYALVLFAILYAHKLTALQSPLFFLSLIAGILYAGSVILVRTKDIPWLKAAGWITLFIGLIPATNMIKNYSRPWMGFVTCLIPICLIVHFIYKKRKTKASVPAQNNWYYAAPAVGVFSLVLILIFGLRLIAEGHTALHGSNWSYQHTKEQIASYDPAIFVKDKDTLRYRLLKPLNYDPAKKYPLVISLPYGGQPATDTIAQLEGAVGAELLTEGDNMATHPAFVFIPNCPPGSGWGGIPHYPEVDSLVFDAILALDQHYSIDEKRRYIIGLSRGAFGAWNFIGKRPDLFAAAIPVAGGGDPALMPRAAHVAVWAFHGAKDHNAPVEGSRNLIAAMKNAGGSPQYTEYPDEGHNIWDNVKTTPGLLDWLFAQHQGQ